METIEIVSTFETNRDMYLRFLDSVDYDTLCSRIVDFENLDFTTMSEDAISQAFIQLLNIDGHFVHNVTVNTLKEKLYFTRIRVNKDKKVYLSKQWFLERPFDPDNRPSRFDFGDKAVLYTSLSTGCAISEVKLDNNSMYTEIKYSNPGPLSVIAIGSTSCPFFDNSWEIGLTESQRKKDETIRDFEYRMIMHNSSDEITSHRVAQAVSKTIFSGINADCILYPSIRCRSGYDYNVAFLDGSKKVELEFAIVHESLMTKPFFGVLFDTDNVICNEGCQPIFMEKLNELNKWYEQMGFQFVDMTDVIIGQ